MSRREEELLDYRGRSIPRDAPPAMGPANGFVSTSFFAFFNVFRAFLAMLLSRVRFAIVFLLSFQTRFAEPSWVAKRVRYVGEA